MTPLLYTSLLVEASDSGALTSGHMPPGSQSDDEDRVFHVRQIPEMEVIRLIGFSSKERLGMVWPSLAP